LAESGKNEEAASLLLRAEADAELAILLSREQAEQSEAAQAVERVRQLRNDNR
jgi:N-acetylmuramic acid 6-phosphate (MurNAc-6-P) etherase